MFDYLFQIFQYAATRIFTIMGMAIAALAGIILFCSFTNWIQDTFGRKPTIEELEQEKSCRAARLLQADLPAVEAYFNAKVPQSIVELYGNTNLLSQVEFSLTSPNADEWDMGYVVVLTPCDVETQKQSCLRHPRWSNGGKVLFEFASGCCTGCYFVEMSTVRQDDSPVYWMHHSDEAADVIAGSVREFLSWKLEPLLHSHS